MGLIKESKKVDLIIKSEPWTDKELREFRKIIKAQKGKTFHSDKKTSDKAKRLKAQPVKAA